MQPTPGARNINAPSWILNTEGTTTTSPPRAAARGTAVNSILFSKGASEYRLIPTVVLRSVTPTREDIGGFMRKVAESTDQVLENEFSVAASDVAAALGAVEPKFDNGEIC